MSNNNVEINNTVYKELLMKTLKYTIDFLEKNNLRWFVGYGTCIGAIRHKGLIPWDDDVDLVMPREDYNKMLRLGEQLKGSGYELASWDTHQSMIPFAKIMNTNTTIWELKYHPYIGGVFVDIFPMDLSKKDNKDIKKDLSTYSRLLRKYQSAMSHYSLKDLVKLAINHKRHFLLEGFLSFFTRRQKLTYLKKMKAIENDNNNKEGTRYVVFPASFAYSLDKEIFSKEWFDDYIMMDFEDMKVRVPIGYDAYLTHVYGDYMQLPPEEKRITRHFHYYVNLQEGLTIDEVKKILKRGDVR